MWGFQQCPFSKLQLGKMQTSNRAASESAEKEFKSTTFEIKVGALLKTSWPYVDGCASYITSLQLKHSLFNHAPHNICILLCYHRGGRGREKLMKLESRMNLVELIIFEWWQWVGERILFGASKVNYFLPAAKPTSLVEVCRFFLSPFLIIWSQWANVSKIPQKIPKIFNNFSKTHH